MDVPNQTKACRAVLSAIVREPGTKEEGLAEAESCRAVGLAKGDAAIATEDFFIPSDTAGLELHLRRKRLAHVEKFPGERTLLLMHGATFSSGSLFDAPVGGASFMDQLAVSGFDVYAVDVRGYGASTWPPELEGAVDPSTQPVRIETAIRDLGTAIDHILEYRRLDQLSLVAMSWGGSVAGAYTAKNNGKIKRLALIAKQCWKTFCISVVTIPVM